MNDSAEAIQDAFYRRENPLHLKVKTAFCFVTETGGSIHGFSGESALLSQYSLYQHSLM